MAPSADKLSLSFRLKIQAHDLGVKMIKNELFNKLIVIAVNGIASNTYRDAEFLKSFCQLPLTDLVDFWSGLSDQTKMSVINNHQDELISWIKAQRVNTND